MSKNEKVAYEAGRAAAKRGFKGSVYNQYGSTHKALHAAWNRGNMAA